MLVQADAFIDNIFLNAQHSKGTPIFVHLGLPSSMIPSFCNW